ncbi:hypothetical protein LAUMK191_03386 [Mycobacterium attenuatum]|nr:hypothetical protein LAUMK191_03386 [Mycobacterium attenuatum]
MLSEILPALLSQLIPVGWAVFWLALDVLTLNIIGLVIQFIEDAPLFFQFAVNWLLVGYALAYGYFGILKIVLEWVVGNLLGSSPLLAAMLVGGIAPQMTAVPGVSLVPVTAPLTTVAAAAPLAAAEIAAVEPVAGVSAAISQSPLTSAAAGHQGAGPLGFSGAAEQRTEVPAGRLASARGVEFGHRAQVPMLPATWHPQPAGV